MGSKWKPRQTARGECKRPERKRSPLKAIYLYGKFDKRNKEERYGMEKA